MSSISLLLFWWSWLSFRVFTFASTSLVFFVDGFPSLFLYINKVFPSHCYWHIYFTFKVLWCWILFRLRHVKILNFIDCTMNSKVRAAIQKILCEAIKTQARYEIKIVEKISTFTNMFYLNFAWSHMWHFQQHLT